MLCCARLLLRLLLNRLASFLADILLRLRLLLLLLCLHLILLLLRRRRRTRRALDFVLSLCFRGLRGGFGLHESIPAHKLFRQLLQLLLLRPFLLLDLLLKVIREAL